VMCADTT